MIPRRVGLKGTVVGGGWAEGVYMKLQSKIREKIVRQSWDWEFLAGELVMKLRLGLSMFLLGRSNCLTVICCTYIYTWNKEQKDAISFQLSFHPKNT